MPRCGIITESYLLSAVSENNAKVCCFFQNIFLSQVFLFTFGLHRAGFRQSFFLYFMSKLCILLWWFFERFLHLKSYDIKKKVVNVLQQTAIIYRYCFIQSINWKLTCFTYHIHILFSGWRRQSLGLLMIRKTNVIQKQIFLSILEVVCARFIKPSYIFAYSRYVLNFYL